MAIFVDPVSLVSSGNYSVGIDGSVPLGVPVSITAAYANTATVNTGAITKSGSREKVMITREQAEALATQAAKALAVVEMREFKFGVDDCKNGDIIYADVRWSKRDRFESTAAFKKQTVYNYAFIKANNKWYSTGKNTGGITWDELIDFLEERYIIRMGIVTKRSAFIKNDEAL